MIYLSNTYKHPELSSKYLYRGEHILVIEGWINNRDDLGIGSYGITKESLIEGEEDGKGYYYLRVGFEVHHINFNRIDNHLNNLWVFSKQDHAKLNTFLMDIFSKLFKLNQVLFQNGIYYLNKDVDYKKYSLREIEEFLKEIDPFPYREIDNVRETIKNMDWSGMDWDIQNYTLDPYSDCSKANPLYQHKGWLERIINDRRFNLTDSRLGELCGISAGHFYRIRKKHRISKSKWGFKRILSNKYILIEIPDDYENPYATQQRTRKVMLEHRYIAEKYLSDLLSKIRNQNIDQKQNYDLEIANKYLIDNRYIPPEVIVHHINLDTLDNRISNLWIFSDRSDHNKCHQSLYELIPELLDLKLLYFRNGKYCLEDIQ